MYILRTVPHYRLHIKIQEKSGAGGGNRTIRAYSFYVTYCKHTNARTAQPAVCPPPMYKIMYNEIGRCGVAHRLRCYEEYCTCTLASSALLSAVSLVRAQSAGRHALLGRGPGLRPPHEYGPGHGRLAVRSLRGHSTGSQAQFHRATK